MHSREWPLPESQLPPFRQLSLSDNWLLTCAPQHALQSCAGSLQSLDLSGMHRSHDVKACAARLTFLVSRSFPSCPSLATCRSKARNRLAHCQPRQRGARFDLMRFA